VGTISSGIGLFSGLNINDLVDQLMAIEAQPKQQLERRMDTLDAQKTAFLDVSARITAMQGRLNSLRQPSFFDTRNATSSNPSALTATATTRSTPGSHQFVVRSLAATQQVVSGGFQSLSSPLAQGTLTVESAAARVQTATRLEALNGYHGVARGALALTDAGGQSATVNIVDARTLNDVVDRINAAGLDVRAAVEDDALVLTETTGGRLEINEVAGGSTAESLGFAFGQHVATDGVLRGASLATLAATTPLSVLNDGRGIQHLIASTDFSVAVGGQTVNVELSETIKPDTRLDRLNHGTGVELGVMKITTRDGSVHEVDLAGAETVDDVRVALQEQTQASDGSNRLNVVMTTGHLVINDVSVDEQNDEEPAGPLVIEDVTGHAARDLGIAATEDSDRLEGRDILHMDSIADVLAAINFSASNGRDGAAPREPLIQGAISADGKAITITGADGVTGALVVAAENDSQSLATLGIREGTYAAAAGVTGTRLIGGVNTTMLSTLNGGRGFAGGVISLAQDDVVVEVDLTDAETLADVTRKIEQAAAAADFALTVGFDRTGTKLTIQSEDGANPLTIQDVNGTFAADTGLAGSGVTLTSDNLQKQYLTEQTLLDDLNNGQGISAGTIRVQDSSGKHATIEIRDLADDNLQTIMNLINTSSVDVQARINDTGDGLVLIDEAGGPGTLTVTDEQGTAARDLNLLGTATDGTIDGSFEFHFEADGNTTLEQLAEQIGRESTLATATIFNDGSPVAPYRLAISSASTGLRGELIIDGGTTGLRFNTLSEARDASIVLGDSLDSGVLMTSSTNTFENVIGGLTLTAQAVSDAPVTVNVQRSFDKVLEAARGFVKDFNSAIDRLETLSDYNVETEQRGILYGESTVRSIEDRLFRELSRVSTGFGGLNRFSQLGIGFGANGKLELDETELQAELERDPEAVRDFFTDPDGGRAVELSETITSIVSAGGLISNRNNALDDQRDLLDDRVDRMDAILEIRRQRLLEEFYRMEDILGQLSAQQDALAGFSGATPSTAAL
jgi:flagellar hook-associated protein 2